MPLPRYAAFVSYRHRPRDRRWAILIMQSLETYRTPVTLVNEAFPDRIGRLYRDEDEGSAASDLSEQIKEALRASDHLIVICSPDTPGSRWVSQEIEFFQSLGKGDRIIPLLIAGEPDESFPEALRRRRVVAHGPDGVYEVAWQKIEPVAADVRPRRDESSRRTEHRAVLRLAAALLGCRYDDLAQREAERARALMRNRLIVAASLIGAALLGALWWWNTQLRVNSVYCANYGERWGIPFCIGPLSASDRTVRTRVYRLRFEAGRLLDMARLNGSGTLADDADNDYESEPWTDRVALWQFGPRSASYFVVTLSGKSGRPIRTITYNFTPDRTEASARFNRKFDVAERQSALGSALGMPVLSSFDKNRRSSIGEYRLTFDVRGLLIRREFEPAGGGATIPDGVGAYGRTYSYQGGFRPTQIHNIDAHGGLLIEGSGIAGERRAYDGRGDLVSLEWLDANEHCRINEQLIARVVLTRNPRGNVVREDYEDSRGLPVERRDFGYAHLLSAYDAHGNQIRAEFAGADGNPVLRKDEGYASMTARYDSQGNATEQAYFGTDHKLILRKDTGAARAVSVYDGQGNVVEQTYFGTDDNPILRKDIGAARMTTRYDSHGNVLEQATFGVDSRPILA
jgi:hypothetical protein